MSHTRHARRVSKLEHCNSTRCLAEDRGIVPEGSSLLFGEVEISDTVDFLGSFQAEAGCSLHMGVILGADVILGSDVIVGLDSIIGDDSTIGDGTKIGGFCTIDGGATIGKNVKIGDGVHIKQGACVDDNAFIGTDEGGTVIGERAQIGPHSDVQGTLNFIDANGELKEIDTVYAKETVPKFWGLSAYDGERHWFDLTPEPTKVITKLS